MYRRKLKHSRVKNLHKFASQKNKFTCLVESSLEFDACFHFEFSPSIAAFEAQPLGYEYEFDNRICRYTPDFLLTHTDNWWATGFGVTANHQMLILKFSQKIQTQLILKLHKINVAGQLAK